MVIMGCLEGVWGLGGMAGIVRIFFWATFQQVYIHIYGYKAMITLVMRGMVTLRLCKSAFIRVLGNSGVLTVEINKLDFRLRMLQICIFNGRIVWRRIASLLIIIVQ